MYYSLGMKCRDYRNYTYTLLQTLPFEQKAFLLIWT